MKTALRASRCSTVSQRLKRGPLVYAKNTFSSGNVSPLTSGVDEKNVAFSAISDPEIVSGRLILDVDDRYYVNNGAVALPSKWKFTFIAKYGSGSAALDVGFLDGQQSRYLYVNATNGQVSLRGNVGSGDALLAGPISTTAANVDSTYVIEVVNWVVTVTVNGLSFTYVVPSGARSLMGTGFWLNGNATAVSYDSYIIEETSRYSFEYTGAPESIVVPAGAQSMLVDIYAAAGGQGAVQGLGGGAGGLGGRLQATIPVTAGETLQVNVGGVGGNGTAGSDPPVGTAGWNGGTVGGGGGGNSGGGSGGGGGGATDIRRGAYALANRIAVVGAGAGGGSGRTSDGNGGGSGGGGGGTTAVAGQGATSTGGGGAGTPSGGGAGGSGAGGATAGALGVGGAAGSGFGGGAGGGYYGGGGGGGTNDSYAGTGAGGGGGSSYVDPVSASVTHTQATRAGNGVATMTFSTLPLPLGTPTNLGIAETTGLGVTVPAGVGAVMCVVGAARLNGEAATYALSGIGGSWTYLGEAYTWATTWNVRGHVYVNFTATPGAGTITATPTGTSTGVVMAAAFVSNATRVVQHKGTVDNTNDTGITADLTAAPSVGSKVWSSAFEQARSGTGTVDAPNTSLGTVMGSNWPSLIHAHGTAQTSVFGFGGATANKAAYMVELAS